MKRRSIAFLLAICMFAFGFIHNYPIKPNINANDNVSYSDITPRSSFDFVKDMKLGWNLGNTLDSIDGKRRHNVKYYETLWGNPVTTKQMIQMVADAGFKTVRIPVTYYDNSDANANIDKAWLDRIEEIVNYVLDCDMYCVINLHHDTGKGAWINSDEEDYAKSSYRLQKLWQQVAERFKNYDDRLVFEGFNELLNKKRQWHEADSASYEITNKLNQLFVDTVRASGGNNATRYLIVNLYAAIASASNIVQFELPSDTIEDHLIVGYHSYNGNTEGMDQIFNYIKISFIDKGIPVVIAEFGMSNTANSNNRQKRYAYISKVISKANVLGITCFWWDNGGKFSSADKVNNFALLDRYNMRWYFPDIVEEMVRMVG